VASLQHGFSNVRTGWPTTNNGLAGRSDREEVWASWCDVGADGAWLVAQSPFLDDLEAQAIAFLLEDFWTPPDAVTPAPELWLDEIVVPIELEPLGDHFVGFNDDGAVVIQYAPFDYRALDLETLQWRDSAPPSHPSTPSEGTERGLETWHSLTGVSVGQITLERRARTVPTARRNDVTYVRAGHSAPTPVLWERERPDALIELALRSDGVAVRVASDSKSETVTISAWRLAPP